MNKVKKNIEEYQTYHYIKFLIRQFQSNNYTYL